MNKLILILSKNTLRANYFTLFSCSLLIGMVQFFVPNVIDIVLLQIVKFLMLFSIAMYVTDHQKVIKRAFLGFSVLCSVNMIVGIINYYTNLTDYVTFNNITHSFTSLVCLLTLLLLLSYSSPKMKSITLSLFIVELYQAVCVPFIPHLSNMFNNSPMILMVGYTIIPFLLMIPLFVLIGINGKKRWTNRMDE